MPFNLSDSIDSGVSGRPGGGGTLSRNAVKIALVSNGIRTAGDAPDLAASEGGLARALGGWPLIRSGFWAIYTYALFVRDRQEWENAIHTIVGSGLDGDRSVGKGREGKGGYGWERWGKMRG